MALGGIDFVQIMKKYIKSKKCKMVKIIELVPRGGEGVPSFSLIGTGTESG